jgi:hypothetical protein
MSLHAEIEKIDRQLAQLDSLNPGRSMWSIPLQLSIDRDRAELIAERDRLRALMDGPSPTRAPNARAGGRGGARGRGGVGVGARIMPARERGRVGAWAWVWVWGRGHDDP